MYETNTVKIGLSIINMTPGRYNRVHYYVYTHVFYMKRSGKPRPRRSDGKRRTSWIGFIFWNFTKTSFVRRQIKSNFEFSTKYLVDLVLTSDSNKFSGFQLAIYVWNLSDVIRFSETISYLYLI